MEVKKAIISTEAMSNVRDWHVLTGIVSFAFFLKNRLLMDATTMC